jgi:hypothetical protein
MPFELRVLSAFSASPRFILTLALLPLSAQAVELHIQFAALERMLSDQLFTEEGRRYVKGTPTTRCNFAYLESPHIDNDNGRLRIRAKFTGRTALNVLGQCVGLGDAFPVTLTATPVYKDGQLRLADVTAVPDNKTGLYIRRVCAALATGLPRDFRYPLESEARKLLEDPARRELHDFAVPAIRVTSGALVLVVDFQLKVK